PLPVGRERGGGNRALSPGRVPGYIADGIGNGRFTILVGTWICIEATFGNKRRLQTLFRMIEPHARVSYVKLWRIQPCSPPPDGSLQRLLSHAAFWQPCLRLRRSLLRRTKRTRPRRCAPAAS